MQFKPNATLNIRTVVLILAAFTFMVLDHHYQVLNGVRSVMTVVVTPLRYIAAAPVRSIHWVTESIATHHQLVQENAELRSEQLLLHAQLHKLSAVKHENVQLRALLRSSTQVTGKMVVAQLQAVAFAPFTQQVLVNKGKSDGVYVGQPLLDADGVMGQVIEVGLLSSRVLLISDARSAIPVQNKRNGGRGIVAGQGYSDQLRMMYVPDTTDFKIGDQLVTSGLGKRYPVSYPVGKIIDIQHIKGETYAQVVVAPSAQLDHTRLVLLVWPQG